MEAVTPALIQFCVLTLFFSVGCHGEKEAQRKQFLQLENALDAISATRDVAWQDKVNTAAALPITHTEIRRIQTLCVSSYREYGDAMQQLEQSRQQVKALESAITHKNAANIEEKHKRARRSILETSRHLNQAENYVQQCVWERHKMKKKLEVIGK